MMGRFRLPQWLRRNRVAQVAVGFAVLALLVSAALTSGAVLTHAFAGTPRVTLRGHVVPALKGKTRLGATSGQKALQLDIALTPRNEQQLQALIAAQNDPHAPLYHHYLTPQQYLGQFGPTQASVDSVTQYLRGQGLVVSGVSPNHLIVHVAGSVSSVEKAFSTQISDFQDGSRVVFAPTVEPSVPSDVAGKIGGIVGLDNVGQYHPQVSRPTNKVAHPNNGSGPYASGFSPSDLRNAYDANNLINGGNNGSGQTIAIFELAGYNASDINAYLSYYHLGSAKYTNVLVDGATNSAGAGSDEVELDMEVVSAIAPGAKQQIYIGPNTDQGVLDTYNRIVTDNTAAVTSTSWGLCEYESGTATLQSLDNIFQQGAAQGQAVFAASGDSGSYSCLPDNGSAAQYSLNVLSPASDPYVVGVGGTSLTTGSGSSYSHESVWNWAPLGYALGSGGGLSSYFPQPTYQSGTGVSNFYSNGFREVPDVSGDGDPNTGYSVYCTTSPCQPYQDHGWLEVGGTSAAAPFWAAVATDTNQYLSSAGRVTLGSASFMLYHVFNTTQPYGAYHDVTVGNNDTSGANQFYPATSGYDLASGIGTPDVWNFARDVAADTLVIAPQAVAVTTPVGVNPPGQTITLQNTGSGSLTWTADSLPAWVTPSATSGTVAANSSQQLALHFDLSQCTPTTALNEQNCTTTLTLHQPQINNAAVQIPVTVVEANLSKTWYFAEGYTGSGFDEYVTVANPNSVTANLTITYLLGSGAAPITKTFAIAPNSRFSRNVSTDVGHGQNVSMAVSSDQPVVAERPMYFTFAGRIPGGTDVLGATNLSANTFAFGYLSTQANYFTYLTVLNTNATPLYANVTYYSQGGATYHEQLTVAGNSRGTLDVNHQQTRETNAALPADVYSAQVVLTSDAAGTTPTTGGLVERPMYFVNATTHYNGAADVVGVAQPLTQWDFAEGFTGANGAPFHEWYALSNPGATATSAKLTLFKIDGSTKTTTVSLNPHTLQMVDVNSLLGTGQSNSAEVTSSQPILAERVMSFDYNGDPGASDVLGAAAPGQLFAFAEGYTGPGFTEYLTIENPNPTQTATVTINFLPSGSSTVTQRVYQIAPHSRFTLNVAEVMPNLSLSVVVLANVPIVAERPEYFNYAGRDRGGHDVVGYQP